MSDHQKPHEPCEPKPTDPPPVHPDGEPGFRLLHRLLKLMMMQDKIEDGQNDSTNQKSDNPTLAGLEVFDILFRLHYPGLQP